MTTRVETPQSQCRVGMARVDITPPVGIYHRMWGAASHEQAEGVHRPLTATVLYLARHPESSPGMPTVGEQVILGLDHCLLGDTEVRRLVEKVAEVARIPPESVVVSYSHTHAAGLMLEDRHGLPGGELIPAYMEQVMERVAESAREAKQSSRLGTIVYGQGKCDLARHRDYWDQERQQYVCGFHPDHPADDTLLVARITADDFGEVLGTVVNYACHPTTLAWDNRLISPDFPGAMREVVEEVTGAPCLFLQGASGELGPKEGFTGCTETADRNGRQLGYAALSVLTSLPPPDSYFQYQGPVVSGATLGVWAYERIHDPRRLQAVRDWRFRQDEIPLPYREELPTLDEAEQQRSQWLQRERAAREAGHDAEGGDCRAMVERQTRLIARLRALPPGPSYPLRVTLLSVGDACWLAVQGESYSLLQTELRRRFPQRSLVIISLAHSWGPSYLPTRDTYGRGVYQESIAVLAPGSLEQLIEELAEWLA
jgi:hypothetical protein